MFLQGIFFIFGEKSKKMNVTIKLDDNIDISFFKRMLFQIKGVQEIQIEDEGQWIKKAIDKSRI